MLGREGWSIWWDRQIPAGKTFDEVIEKAINDAKCVVVVWTKESVNSRWVKTEAAEAAERGILIPILLENVKVPFEFRRIQAAQLINWNGDVNDESFIALLSSITATLGKPVNPNIKEIGKGDITLPSNQTSASRAHDFEHLKSKERKMMGGGNAVPTLNEVSSILESERRTKERSNTSIASSANIKSVKGFSLSNRSRLAVFVSGVILTIIVVTIVVFRNKHEEPLISQSNAAIQNLNNNVEISNNSPTQPNITNPTDTANRVVAAPVDSPPLVSPSPKVNPTSSPTPKTTPTPRPSPSPPVAGQGSVLRPTVKLLASANVVEVECGRRGGVELTAEVINPDGATLLYSYSATGGMVAGSGPHARWYLNSDVAPGTYIATVAVGNASGGVSFASVQVLVKKCLIKE